MIDLILVLAPVLASLFVAASMGIYITRLVKGKTKAIPTAWLIGCIAMLLQNITHYHNEKGNLRELYFGIFLNLCILFILIYSRKKERFGRLSPLDITILLFAFGIVIFRQFAKNDQIANLSVQCLFILSVIPTLRGLIQGTIRDHHLPWVLGVIAYLFQIITVVTNPHGWNIYALAFPVIAGVIGNGTIAVTAFWRNRKNALCEPSP